MTEKEIDKFFDDFVLSLVNRIAVFILEEGFMPRLKEAVLRADYKIFEEEVNSVLLHWAPKRVDVISEEYRFLGGRLKWPKNKILKIYAYRIANLSQSALYFLSRHQNLTTNDYQFLKAKLVDLYSRALELLIMADASDEEINDFINDYEEKGDVK